MVEPTKRPVRRGCDNPARRKVGAGSRTDTT